jgi:hypothetical protein
MDATTAFECIADVLCADSAAVWIVSTLPWTECQLPPKAAIQIGQNALISGAPSGQERSQKASHIYGDKFFAGQETMQIVSVPSQASENRCLTLY